MTTHVAPNTDRGSSPTILLLVPQPTNSQGLRALFYTCRICQPSPKPSASPDQHCGPPICPESCLHRVSPRLAQLRDEAHALPTLHPPAHPLPLHQLSVPHSVTFPSLYVSPHPSALLVSSPPACLPHTAWQVCNSGCSNVQVYTLASNRLRVLTLEVHSVDDA